LSIDKDINVKTAFRSKNMIINYPIGVFFADVVFATGYSKIFGNTD